MFVVVYPDDQRTRAVRLYYPRHPDLGASAPAPVAEPRDTPPRRLQQPYRPRPQLYLQHPNQDVQFQSATFEPRDTPPRQLQQSYNPRSLQRLLYRQQREQQDGAAEPRDGWIPKPLPGQYNPRAAQQYLFRQQWAEDVQQQSATFEPRDTPPRQLQQPYRPRPQLLWFGHPDAAAEAAQESTDVQWTARRVQPPPFRPRPGLYLWTPQTGESAPAEAETNVHWPPRSLAQPYRPRPQLYWFSASEAAAEAAQESTDVQWSARFLRRPYAPRPQLFVWHPNQDVQFQSATNEPRDGWSPRPLSGTRLLVRSSLLHHARALDVPPAAGASGAARSVAPQWIRRLELLHLRGWGGLGS